MNALKKAFKEIMLYPSAVVGVVIIILLIAVSIYTIVAIPYDEAIRLWRGGEEVWYNSPKNAHPRWVNWFRKDKLPESLTLNSQAGSAAKTVTAASANSTDITLSFVFDFQSDEFPNELSLYFTSEFQEKQPHVSNTWITPDGREIRLSSFALEKGRQTYRLSLDERLQRKLDGQYPHVALFADPNSAELTPLKGRYELRVDGIVFEQDADIDCEFVMFGQVSGWAGTDHRRRDLTIALLWGIPTALIFGLVAATGTILATLFISAIGTWYGGWLDEIINRVTEINIILPLLPILIMIGTCYSRSIWVILGVVIVFSIFTGDIKTYRAMFLQVKASAYIEAAQAYGASNLRVIFRYLIPRVIPLLIPQFVISVPAFVFLEAALAVLGLGDPILPTWGKVINEADANGALYNGYYYWVLEPSMLLIITGLAFAMVGYSLDRVFNPRLRGV